MAKLKSLGLASARTATSKALRKLFGLRLSTADGQGEEEVDGASASKQSQGTRKGTDTTTETTEDSEQPAQAAERSKTNTASSGLPENEMTADSQQRNHFPQEDKENQPPNAASAGNLVVSLDALTLDAESKAAAAEPPVTPEAVLSLDPAVQAERARHMAFMDEALDMARLALRTNETPVGCVLVHDGKVIARGMNATNVTRNGTRHAEFMALSALLSYPPKKGPRTTSLKPKLALKDSDESSDSMSVQSRQPDEGNEDGQKGHLYPYGQKEHPDARVNRELVRESILYVTVEPCVMCASLLRQLNVKKVYFGAVNDKFGGTGGVFSIHANSLPVRADGQTASAHPTPKPTQLPDGSGILGTSFPEGGGDGGNVEAGYEIEGGWGRDEAVALLRRFYVQENGRAPVPRKKEGRAARLAAMMEKDGDATAASILSEAASSGDLETDRVSLEAGKENVAPEPNYKTNADTNGVLQMEI